MGDVNRQIGIKGNDKSSRATTIFRVIIEKLAMESNKMDDIKVTKTIINFVDLSGSEHINDSFDSSSIVSSKE